MLPTLRLPTPFIASGCSLTVPLGSTNRGGAKATTTVPLLKEMICAAGPEATTWKQIMRNVGLEASHAWCWAGRKSCVVWGWKQVMRGAGLEASHAWCGAGSKACILMGWKQAMHGVGHGASHAWYCAGSKSCVVIGWQQDMRGVGLEAFHA